VWYMEKDCVMCYVRSEAKSGSELIRVSAATNAPTAIAANSAERAGITDSTALDIES